MIIDKPRTHNEDFRECIVCDKIFYVSYGKKGKKGAKYRPKKAVTCSKKCSSLYNKNQNKYKKDVKTA